MAVRRHNLVVFAPRLHLRLVAAAALALALMSPARASASEPPAREQAAQELYDAVFSSGSIEDAEACGAAYVELYNTEAEADADTTQPAPDELLWRAAQCFERAFQVGMAIVMRRRLADAYPDSVHGVENQWQLASSLASVTYYELAATYYEDFAATYPKDARGADALHNAYLFRVGLDQSDAAQANLAAYEALYARKDPKRAAQVFWSGRELLTTDTQRREHALAYLKTYSSAGELDRRVVAEFVLGQLDWRRSCKEPLLWDTCISVVREGPASPAPASDTLAPGRFKRPKRCGDGSQARVTVHRRDAKLAAAAQARFELVVRIAGGGDKEIDIPEAEREREREFSDAWGLARVYQADARFEQYLALSFPTKLDFYANEEFRNAGVAAEEREYARQRRVVEASQRRLRDYLEAKLELGHALREQYFRVKTTGSPDATIMAAQRVGWLSRSFADQFTNAPVPRSLNTKAQLEAYCGVLADQAHSLAQQASEAFEYCLERSVQWNNFTAYSRQCEAELQRERNPHYPATVELFGEASYATRAPESVGLLASPESVAGSAPSL